MKQILFAVGILFVAVAVYALSRILPDETVMALVGVMCGIIASIPLSVLLLVTLTRDRSAYVSAPETQTWTEMQPMTESDWEVLHPNTIRLPDAQPRQLKP